MDVGRHRCRTRQMPRKFASPQRAESTQTRKSTECAPGDPDIRISERSAKNQAKTDAYAYLPPRPGTRIFCRTASYERQQKNWRAAKIHGAEKPKKSSDDTDRELMVVWLERVWARFKLSEFKLRIELQWNPNAGKALRPCTAVWLDSARQYTHAVPPSLHWHALCPRHRLHHRVEGEVRSKDKEKRGSDSNIWPAPGSNGEFSINTRIWFFYLCGVNLFYWDVSKLTVRTPRNPLFSSGLRQVENSGFSICVHVFLRARRDQFEFGLSIECSPLLDHEFLGATQNLSVPRLFHDSLARIMWLPARSILIGRSRRRFGTVS
ncbi:hypothetical protein B0H14DRAFT_3608612 [Mycena olivaceomarginata]|nr:hypothetical protein B0H14DRAFT_3608612 [Mycena olivaceomarginata]